MAFSLQNGSGHDDEPMADINVTPFVDVVLVLLIIFMITAAVVEFGMQIGVPPTRVAATPSTGETMSVQVLSDGRLAMNGREVNLYQIVPDAKKADPDEPKVYVQIHRLASYEMVAQVLAECRAGDVEVNLIPQPLRRDPRLRR